jgi:hypothetical protein
MMLSYKRNDVNIFSAARTAKAIFKSGSVISANTITLLIAPKGQEMEIVWSTYKAPYPDAVSVMVRIATVGEPVA